MVILPDGVYEEWSRSYNASNGCGTTTTFSGSDTGLASPGAGMIDVGACSTTCSYFTTRTLYG